jgi:hypothetical protein
MTDPNTGQPAPTVEQLQAENDQLRAEIAAQGTGVLGGPGTPDYFYSVGGVGDVVPNITNPVSGAPIVQEHPRVAAQAALDAANEQLATAQARADMQLTNAQDAVANAQAELDGADARWDEIVADLTARQ